MAWAQAPQTLTLAPIGPCSRMASAVTAMAKALISRQVGAPSQLQANRLVADRRQGELQLGSTKPLAMADDSRQQLRPTLEAPSQRSIRGQRGSNRRIDWRGGG